MRQFFLSIIFAFASIPLFSTHFSPAFLPNCLDIYASVEGGYYWIQVPEFVYASQAEPSFPTNINERYISQLTAKDYIDSPYAILTGGVSFYPTCSPFRRISMEGFGLLSPSSDKNREFNFPQNGNLFIIPLIDGTTVFTTGGSPTESVVGFLNRHYDYSGAGARIKGYIPWKCVCVTPYLAYEHYEVHEKIQARFELTAGPFVSTNLEEKLDICYDDFGAGIELSALFCSRLLLSGYGAVYASYAATRFTGFQSVVSTASPTASVSDRTAKDSYKLKAGVELGWLFNCFSVSVVGNIESWGYIPQIVNPVFESFPATIKGQGTFFGSIGAKVSVPY